MTELPGSAVTAAIELLHEWSCPRCGATTRARMADLPSPGDAVSAWLERMRDRYPGPDRLGRAAIDAVLAGYRAHAEHGIPLDRDVPAEETT